MLISHKYKFIFIKTRKTASTSIEMALSQLMDEGDAITPIAPKDEKTRTDMGIFPRNYSGRFNLVAEFFHENRNIERSLKDFIKARRYYNHLAAEKIRSRLGKEKWDSYYKFCFDRNPWDKCLSHYYWKNRETTFYENFDAYINSGDMCFNRQLYTTFDEVIVDDVFRYEDLATELPRIMSELGVPFDNELPRAKSGIRKKGTDYRDVLSNEQSGRIAEAFAKEIALMGYEF
jgi:hypothetical protein